MFRSQVSKVLSRLNPAEAKQSKHHSSRQAKREAFRNRLRVEDLEDRRMLATLFWQGDVDGNMSTSGNWADDLAGTDTGAVPAAGDTLVFNTNTNGFTASVITADLDPSVTGLIIESVNDTPGVIGLTGPGPLSVISISHSGTGDPNAGLSINTPLVLAADAAITSNVVPAANFANAIGIADPVSGNFAVTVNGAGGVVLQRAFGGRMDNTGGVNVNGVYVETSGAGQTASVTVNAGGLASGFVQSGPLNVLGGTVSPGFSPGSFNVTDLNLADGSTFDIEINAPGNTAGSDFDVINASGTVTIGDVDFNILPASTEIPTPADGYVVINNTGMGAVNVLPTAPAERSIVATLNGVPLQITYQGGDGNDVVLFAAEERTDIIGFKFTDLNGNGVADVNDPRLNGVDFYIDANANGVFDAGEPVTTSTDFDLDNNGTIDLPQERGIFMFDVPTNLDILIREIVPVDSVQSTPDPGAINLALGTYAIAPGLINDPNDNRTRIDVEELRFGNFQTLEFNGQKFEDLDGNGFRDAGEPGLGGVTIELRDGGGAFITSVQTDPSGNYQITGIAPGDFQIHEIVPTGFVQTRPAAGFYTLNNLTSGTSVFAADFGNLVLGSIHGFKFEDLNADGVQDAGEPPLAGVEFTLTGDVDGDGTVDTVPVFTDVTGQFSFLNLFPGDYNVSETVPAGFVASTPISRDFTIQSRQAYVWTPGAAGLPVGDPRVEVLADSNQNGIGDQLIFGNFAPVSVAGMKFEDLNGDGIQNGGEPGLPGVTIELEDEFGVLVATAQTDINGEYQFAGLIPGIYQVREVVPPGFVQTAPPAGFYTFNTQSGDQIDDADFGNTVLGSIHGFKFEDVVGDGINNGTDQPLQNIEFILTGDIDGDGIVDTTNAFTDVNGQFDFLNLYPGDYTVEEVIPAGSQPSTPIVRNFTIQSRDALVWQNGAANIPAGDLRVEFLADSNGDGIGDELMFGNTFLASIHGFKFEDLNGDRAFNQGVETGLAGVQFDLIGDADGNGTVDILTVFSDAQGAFEFVNLYPGTYDLVELVPTGFVPTTALNRTFTLESRDAFVWQLGAANLLPGDPRVEFLADSNQDGIGDELLFGNTVLGSIHGFKFEDSLGDGTFQVGTDSPFPGVVFNLTGDVDGDGTVDTISATTNVDGEFEFVGLFPGSYTVEEVLPAGTLATTPTVRNFVINSRQEYVWAPGAANLPQGDLRMEVLADSNQDGIGDELMFGNAFPGQITGRKFEDLDANGLYNLGENFLNGVTIELLDANGVVVATTVTQDIDLDQNGFINPDTERGIYEFTNLFPGQYSVREVVPAGLVQTFPPTGQYDLTVPSGAVFFEQNFGNFVPGSIHGFKYEDIDFDRTFTAGTDIGLPAIDFQITGTDFAGNPITIANDIQTTDINGEFWFTGLVPGNYTVQEIVPVGYTASTPTSFSTTVLSGQEFVAFAGQYMPVLGATILDQVQPNSNFNVGVQNNLEQAQTFVPGTTGFLQQVDLQVSTFGMMIDGDVIMEIQTLDGLGQPSGNVLATATIPGGTIPVADNQALSFDFSAAPASLTAGVAYAFVLSSPTSTVTLGVASNDIDSYFPGIAFDSPDNGVSWVPRPNGDLLFSTTMEQLFNEEIVVGQPLQFGNTVFGSLHGFKYEDIDGNGIYDNTIDAPLAGVTFFLEGTTADGTLVSQQSTTDVNGEFWFTSLPPSVFGTGLATGYRVTESVPFGFVNTTSTSAFTNLSSRQELVWQAGASDVDPNNPDERRVEIVVDNSLLTFGNTVPGSIHGFKFEDINGNGTYEPNFGEFPLPGVEFTLTGTDSFGNAVNQTVVTDTNGEFWFVGLLPSIAGQTSASPNINQTGYTVTETVPVGYVPTTLPIARTFDLRSRIELVWANGAANLPAAPTTTLDQSQSISTTMRLTSGNVAGAQTFTPSITGQLTSAAVTIETTGTPGDVILEVQTVNALGQPTGFVLASSVLAAANVPADSRVDINFEYAVPADLIAGRQYALVLSSPTTTNPGDSVSWAISFNDPYAFGQAVQANVGELPDGVYFPIGDYVFSTVMLPSADPRMEFLADSNLDGVGDELIWGNVRPGEIHGYKFNDTNGNGVQDAGEAGLDGFVITLTDLAGNPVFDRFGNEVQSQTTSSVDMNGDGQIGLDEVGLYWFLGLLPGTYLVREVQQAGWIQTTHDPQPLTITRGEVYVARSGLGNLDPFDPREELVDKCLHFGNLLSSSIHGYKFEDLNGDGIDNNDPRWQGVTITLTGDVDGDGVQDQLVTQTDANGEYWFDNIYPGTYTITETVPAGSIRTTASSVTVTVASGEEVVAVQGQATLDPGQFESVDVNLAIGNTYPGSIHGYKFEDINGDGDDENGGDPRLPGITITLTGDIDGDGDVDQITTQTSPVTGEFWFTNLYPGTYTVAETVPPGSSPTTNISTTITIVSREAEVAQAGQSTSMGVIPFSFESAPNPSLAFGNIVLGSIHGHKWEDIDGDGIEDPNEPRLNGWTVSLTDSFGNAVTDFFGNIVQPVVTQNIDLNGDGQFTNNEIGLYWFSNLRPGTYVVREQSQQGWLQTSHDPQPITITNGQVYVAQADQLTVGPDDPRRLIVDKCLSFGNQRRGELEWQKFDKHGNLLGGVIFTLTRTHDFDQATGLFTDIVDVPIVVVDNLLPDLNGNFGEFYVADLPLGRYTLTETFPVPGYDPDTFVEVIEFTTDDRLKVSTHTWVNSWSKRAFVGSTLALRLAYLESIGLAEAQLTPEQIATALVQRGFGSAVQPDQPVMTTLSVVEDPTNISLIHASSGNIVAQQELDQAFAIVTTDLDERIHVPVLSLFNRDLTIQAGGGDDIVDLENFNVQSVDGGAGFDKLRVNEVLDVAGVVSGLNVQNIEAITLSAADQRLAISNALVQHVTGTDPLRVEHQTAEQLQLPADWRVAGSAIDGDRVLQILTNGTATIYATGASPWQNLVDRLDVDGDGFVSPIDALLGVNRLNANPNGSLDLQHDAPTTYLDVNGDHSVSPLDILLVVNRLNEGGVGEGEAVPGLDFSTLFTPEVRTELPTWASVAAYESGMAPRNAVDDAVVNWDWESVELDYELATEQADYDSLSADELDTVDSLFDEEFNWN